LIRINNSQGAARGINPAIKRHLELEAKTLQKYTEDQIVGMAFKSKEREEDEAIHMEDTQKG
jgi:hypothetical protein